jgi:hypothetical protein
MTIRINIDDVVKHGGVVAAIEARCPEEITLATPEAMGGQTFQTSGPGPGWSRNLTAADYATRAIEEDIANSGCDPSESSALDPTDGRLAHGVDPDDEDEEWSGEIEWEDESCVRVACPSVEDALDYPAEAAKMLQSVIDYHSAESDTGEWRKLVETIRKAAEEFEDIDLDDLDEN